jgi:hypothetical protein
MNQMNAWDFVAHWATNPLVFILAGAALLLAVAFVAIHAAR